MWSAIPVALLCMNVRWSERKQGSSPKGDEILSNTGGLPFFQSERAGIAEISPDGANLRSESLRAVLKQDPPEKVNLRPERTYLKPERAALWPERAYLKSDRADLWPDK